MKNKMNIKEMSLKEKIGQMFMVGVMDDDHLRQVLFGYHVGGIVHFSRNGESAKEGYEFFNKAKKLSKTPLITTIDQEGGIVTRIKEGMTPVSGCMAIGATADYSNAQKASEIMAYELGLIGVNMNLAPVVDVNNNPQNPVINVRSFGEVAEKVASFGVASLNGYKKQGMLAVAKHFPGHGDTSSDSHFDLPIVESDLKSLRETELVPFKAMIDKDVDGIMISHVLFKAIDPDKPATLSKEVVSGLLKEDLSYKGLIISDCMEMHAVAKRYPPEQAVIMAVSAGIDMMIYSSDLDMQVKSMTALYEAVKSGVIPEDRIDESVEKILKVKNQLKYEIMPWEEVYKKLENSDRLKTSLKIARKSITSKEILPFEPSKGKYFDACGSDNVKAIFSNICPCSSIKDEDMAIIFYKKADDLKGILEDRQPSRTLLVLLGSPYEEIAGFTNIFTYEATILALKALKDVLDEGKIEGILPIGGN